MAIYDVQLCGSESTIQVEIEGANINDVWYIKDPTPGREQNLCGIVTNLSEATFATYTGITSYNNCYECVQDLVSALYTFAICGSESVWAYITPSDFGSLPAIGDVFYLTVERRGQLFSECVFFSGIEFDSINTPTVFVSQVSYIECEICLFTNTPRSANTETVICNYCCDCGASGETITQITPEHPVWTDGYGIQVTQTNMVVIGRGFNG